MYKYNTIMTGKRTGKLQYVTISARPTKWRRCILFNVIETHQSLTTLVETMGAKLRMIQNYHLLSKSSQTSGLVDFFLR